MSSELNNNLDLTEPRVLALNSLGNNPVILNGKDSARALIVYNLSTKVIFSVLTLMSKIKSLNTVKSNFMFQHTRTKDMKAVLE